MISSKPLDAGKGAKEKSKHGGASAITNAKFQTEVTFSPDTASCEGNSNICLIFDEIPGSLINGEGRVEICVTADEKLDRIVAKQINERTFRFLAPSNREGDASAVVFINGTQVASSYLHYRSDTAHLVAGLSQIYLQFLNTVCRYMYTLQTKHQIQSPIPELDRLLAESFEDSDNKHNIPPKALEELFDIFHHYTADVVQSKYELPTLLHLAGEYGLEQLAENLLDLPGATSAGYICNENGRTASELARNNGFLKLARTISTPNKTKSGREGRKNPLNTDQGGDYVLQDYTKDAFEDNYPVLPQQLLQSNTAACGGKPQKPPPSPCQTFVERKMLSSGISESLPALPPRSSSMRTVAPPPLVPRRESRDSGVNIDASQAPGPPPTIARKRPPLLRGFTDPSSVYNDEDTNKNASTSSGSSQGPAGKTVQRNVSLSGREIARQLMKPVPRTPGPKEPSITK